MSVTLSGSACASQHSSGSVGSVICCYVVRVGGCVVVGRIAMLLCSIGSVTCCYVVVCSKGCVMTYISDTSCDCRWLCPPPPHLVEMPHQGSPSRFHPRPHS